MNAWNPDQYLSHADLHSQAIADLVQRIAIQPPRTAADLGCGPGNSTEFLAERWPSACLTGVDLSAEMLAKGRARHPGWNWILSGIDDFHPAEPFDAVVSCAALQWLPRHQRLLPQLWSLVQSGGALAVQMPANQEFPLHRAIFQTARSGKWIRYTGNARAELNFQPPLDYFAILSQLTRRIDLWETVYYQEMPSLDSLLDWARGTVMRPFLSAIPEAGRQSEFIADVKAACSAAYPSTKQGTIVYAHKRLFFIGYKTGAA